MRAARRASSLRSPHWPIACGLYPAIGGLLSVAGWAFDYPRLTDWFNNGISIQPNAALAAAAVGFALICFVRGYRKTATALGAVVVGLGVTVLIEHLAQHSLGIDSWLLFGRAWGRSETTHPGRMGMPAATSWTIIGGAILLAALPDRASPVRRFAPVLASVSAAVASLSLIGYMYGANLLYSIPFATAIALQTSTFVLAAAIGVILAVPEHGPARLLTEDSGSGAMLRRLLPLLILIPLLLGYFRLSGQRAGYYELAFGTAARTLVEIGFLMWLVWWAAAGVGAEERERAHVESRLIENERLLRTVTEEAEVGLVIVNPDHTYAYANRAYGEIIAAAPGNLVGRHVRDVLPDVYETRIRPKVESAFAGQVVTYELELPERDQFVSVTYQPQFGSDGTVETVIVAIVDTTDRRRAEEALKRSQVELEDAARRKDEFLMTLAHELRNPLAPIRTAIDTMKRSSVERELSWARDVVDRQLRLMVRLLDDLLDVGRVARDRLTLRRAPIDLAVVVQGALEISQPLAEQNGQQIHVSLPPNPVFVMADLTRMEQVVANLLNNACRYSPDGARIDVAVSREDDVASIAVKDRGIGLAAADLARIFEMFSQLDRSLERTQSGLGIGLHLVKGLVELHGGTVEARSDGPGLGSEFIVRIPALPAGTVMTRTEPESVRTDVAPSKPRRILVVDDNVDAAEALSMLLRMNGHDTHLAHDGLRAVEAAAEVRPNVILLDIGLPQLNGYEVCRRIRALTIDPQPVIIALTGWGQNSDRTKSRAAGFDHHLVKPVDFESLEELLAEI